MVGPLLTAEGLTVRYGDIPAVRGIDFDVARGEIVVLLGLNGAGKSSTLNALVGLVPAGGKVTFADRSISGMATEDIVRQGIALVPEGRRVFPDLTVAENLHLGAAAHLAKGFEKALLDEQLERFPILKERYQQKAGLMSGGEQQMLAIARALMSRPKLLLLDEPSLGLAPQIIAKVFDLVVELNASGISILLVEQNAVQALDIASRGYVIQMGEIIMSGPARDLAQSDLVRQAYLAA
jgi:branched-chain amino acid transport system ATP-binding protein